MPLIIIGAWAVALFIALRVGRQVVTERGDVKRTLGSLDSFATHRQPARSEELGKSFWNRALLPVFGSVSGVARSLTPASATEKIGRDLLYAGSPENWDAERLLAAKLVCGVAGALLGLLFGISGNSSAGRVFFAFVIFTAFGFLAPSLVIKRKGKERQDLIRRALPDTLDQLAIAAEAGLGFDAAVSRVSAETEGPLADELNRMLKEMQLGKSRSEALHSLAERTTVEELRSFVLAMVQADTFGLPIVNVLQVQAKEMRIKRRQRAEEQAQKVPVKMVFPLITCIFPGLFVVILGPALINIYHTFAR